MVVAVERQSIQIPTDNIYQYDYQNHLFKDTHMEITMY